MSCRRKKVRNVRPKERDEEGREDRISRLPDELIHRILSFLDAKYAVETSLLSTRWKHVWKYLSHLNFDGNYFTGIHDFSNFVNQYLCHRDHQSDLFVVNLNCTTGSIQRSLLQNIAIYGASHNLQQLSISSDVHQLPPDVFTIQSLKQLSLTIPGSDSINILNSSFVLPSLTMLVFKEVVFDLFRDGGGTNKSIHLFSNLLNLKSLALIDCRINGLDNFYINSPGLENLHIKFNIPTRRGEFKISAPKLSSFKYEGNKPLLISASDLPCLNKLYLDVDTYIPVDYERKQRISREILNMFCQLHDAKFVTLTLRTIYSLSFILESLESQPCPFHQLECLKVEGSLWWSRNLEVEERRLLLEHGTLYAGVLTYLCNSCPGTTIINEFNSLFSRQ